MAFKIGLGQGRGQAGVHVPDQTEHQEAIGQDQDGVPGGQLARVALLLGPVLVLVRILVVVVVLLLLLVVKGVLFLFVLLELAGFVVELNNQSINEK